MHLFVKTEQPPGDCPTCGMPRDYMVSLYGDPQCWNWNAKVSGECPYFTEDGEEIKQ